VRTAPLKTPQRRVVVVEFDVTCLSPAEIDSLLVCALRCNPNHDVSFQIGAPQELARR
jgi:hypothetical protein